MQLLLDTHVFLWWVDDSRRLSRKARAAVRDPDNDCLLSLASCWELAIKISLGKLKLASPIERFVPEQLNSNGFRLLDIDFTDVASVAKLVFHHRDRFDRLLAAQALRNGLSVVSQDPVFAKYGVKRVW